MARRRSLSKQISLSEQVDQLSDRAALLFTWMIPHADDYGRLPGSTRKLMGMVIPLRRDKEGWSFEDVEGYLKEMEDAVDDEGLPLINRYKVNGISVIQLVKFDKHQEGIQKRTKSSYPDPPGDERLSLAENDIRDLILKNISNQIGGKRVLKIGRQVRVKESYLDIVAWTQENVFVIEVKRTRLSNNAVEQITKYCDLIGKGKGVLVGNGLSGNFDIGRCKERDIAVVTYDNELEFEVVLPSSTIKTVNDLGFNVISRDSTLRNVNFRREEKGKELEKEKERSAAAANISSMIDRSAKSVPDGFCQDGNCNKEKVSFSTGKEACGGGVAGGGELIKLFEGEFGRTVSPLEADQIFAMSDEFDFEVVKEALKRATLAGRPTLRYVNGILSSWRMNNCRSIREVLEYEAGIEKLKLGRKGNGDSNGNGNRDSPVDRLKLEKRHLEESVRAAIDYIKLQLGDKPSLQDVRGFFEKYDYGPEVRDRVLEMYSSGGEPP